MPIDSANSDNKGVGTLTKKPEILKPSPKTPSSISKKDVGTKTEKEKARELYQTRRKKKRDTKKSAPLKGKASALTQKIAQKIGGKAISRLKAGTAGFFGVYGLALVIAISNDILDYLGFIGSIPLLGDIVDVATSAILWPLLGGVPALFSIVELIPFVDLLPTYTIIVLISFILGSTKRMVS